jgi:putative transposase
MARPLRLEHANALWHVTARGNEKKEIFRDDFDRELFLRLLGETVIRFGWRLIAWVLMGNHYHLEVQTPDPNLSRGMHWLNGRYAQRFNRRHDRCGHLFQGRFKGILVERESYMLTLARYIVLNPVRAGISPHPSQYRWSSYQQTAGITSPDPWLAASDLLEHLAPSAASSRLEYLQFVDAGIRHAESPWTNLEGQIFLGSADWIESMAGKLKELEMSPEHPRIQRSIGRPKTEDVLDAVAATLDTTVSRIRNDRGDSLGRALAAFLLFEDAWTRQAEISEILALRSRSTASAIIRRFRARAETDTTQASLVAACRSRMRRHAPEPGFALPSQLEFYNELRTFCRVPRTS